MKSSIIFLLALIVLCALPVLAKPIPVFDIIQISLNMDEQFLDLYECSDDELILINGEGSLLNPNPEEDSLVVYDSDGSGGLSCDQVEIKYGKDGKPKRIIITNPVYMKPGTGHN